MILPKRDLVTHLERIYTDGQVTEAVLTGRWQTAAITPDKVLLVVADGLPGADPLPEEVGVLDTAILIRALRSLADDPEGQVSVEFTGYRILIEERGHGRIRLVTGAPSTISTQIHPDHLSKALEFIKAASLVVPLPQSVVHGVLSTASLVKAEHVTIFVGEDKGLIQVGSQEHHHAEIDVSTLRAAEPYKVVLPASVFVSVLRQVHDFTTSELVMAGPDMVAVRNSGYLYVISPLNEGS